MPFGLNIQMPGFPKLIENEMASRERVIQSFYDRSNNGYSFGRTNPNLQLAAKDIPDDLKAIAQTIITPFKNQWGHDVITAQWYRLGWPGENHSWNKVEEKHCPLFLVISCNLYGEDINLLKPSPYAHECRDPYFSHRIPDQGHYSSYGSRGGIVFELNHEGHSIQVVAPDQACNRCFGLKFYEPNLVGFKDGPLTEFPIDIFASSTESTYYNGQSGRTPFDFSLDTIGAITRLWDMDSDSLGKVIKAIKAKGGLPTPEQDAAIAKQNGIAKTWAKIVPFVSSLQNDNISSYIILRSFMKQAGRTVESVKLSTLFNQMFEDAKGAQDIIDILPKNIASDRQLMTSLQETKLWTERRKVAIKAKGNRAFSLLMQEYEFLKLDEKRFPITSKTIKDGEIPLGTFFTKREQYFLQNDNWPLWEEMLKKHKAVTLEMAAEVSKRTTYEKDLMSYFYFILHALPAYLKRHTGKKWTCLPRLVENQNELEPDQGETGQPSRKRSALTPIVDNEKNTVTVPYASLAIPGRQTTYCYGLDFQVLTTGQSVKGNVVMDEIESGLNGRDDYGLMYYTLTGSAQGRGYPTFLIIFEHREHVIDVPLGDYRNGKEKKHSTFVHFHRTHPSRSKDGDYNGIHNWIKTTYNWMVGNVNRSNVVEQQGDLVFVKHDGDVVFEKVVDGYDNHKFERPVKFAEYNGKENILGFVRITESTKLNHHEHMSVELPEGTYAIRQCRSWEANPKGIWSLRID